MLLSLFIPPGTWHRQLRPDQAPVFVTGAWFRSPSSRCGNSRGAAPPLRPEWLSPHRQLPGGKEEPRHSRGCLCASTLGAEPEHLGKRGTFGFGKDIPTFIRMRCLCLWR